LARGRRRFRVRRPMRTVGSENGLRSYRGREQCDSRSPRRKRSPCAASHFSAAVRGPGSLARSIVDQPRARTVPGNSAREQMGLAPDPLTPRPFREDASPLVFRSLVVSASPSPHSKYSAPRMLSCGGGGDDGGGVLGGVTSSEFFRIDLTL